MIGETVGSYRIVSRLGKGGMGIVYIAEHGMLSSRAVVKMLTAELSEDREALDRFFNEAKAATQIKHPSIVQIFDFGIHAGSGGAYIVMELLEGESLSARIQHGRLAPHAAAVIARKVASALGAAHKSGIVHRDLKPDNLFLVPDPELPEGERVKVLDFGIAKLSTSRSAHATRTGQVLGTSYYMSPEQCRNAASVDARTDIYALGCILYEMLTGRPPFSGTSITELITAHLFETPTPPGQLVSEMPSMLEQTVLRALAKSADERQPTMAALVAELDAITGRRMATPLPVASGSFSPIAPTAIPASPPTTLGRATGQIVTHPTRPRWALRIGIAAASVVVAAIVAFVVVGHGGQDSELQTGAKASSHSSVAAPATPAADQTGSAGTVTTAIDAGMPDAATIVEAPIDGAAPVAVKRTKIGVGRKTTKQPNHVRKGSDAPASGSGSATRFGRGD